MRLVLLLAPVALLPPALSAQTSAPPSKSAAATALQGAVAAAVANTAGCPVTFQASHGQQGAVVNVSPQSPRPEQSYRLTFEPGGSRSVAQARITMHGLSGAQVVPAGRDGGNVADRTESFHLSPASDAQHRFHATVYTRQLTGVQWIELNDLTYTDGTTWHASAAGLCRITPNGYMLVAAGN